MQVGFVVVQQEQRLLSCIHTTVKIEMKVYEKTTALSLNRPCPVFCYFAVKSLSIRTNKM